MRISDWSSDVCSSDLLDGLRHVELNPVAGRHQNLLDHRKDHRIEDELRRMGRALEQGTEALGPLAIEAAPAEGRCRKDRIKNGFERGNGSDRQSIGNSAIALGSEMHGPGRIGEDERVAGIHWALPETGTAPG